MVHHVSKHSVVGSENLTIDKDVFFRFIERLVSEEVRFLTPDQIDFSESGKRCLLTFDDVCNDAWENAFDFLEKKEIPYVCFVTPSFVGKQGYISKDALRSLVDSRFCTVGAHGIHHKMFRQLSDSEKKAEMSKSEHEKLLGCVINDFAFPFGSIFACDKKSIQLANQSYSRVYSTMNCRAKTCTDIRFIPRINLNTVYAASHMGE